MNEPLITQGFPGIKLLVGLACLIIFAAGFKSAQSVFLPILFAFFLAVLGTPFIRYLTERRVPKVIAVLAVAGDDDFHVV